MSKLNPKGQEAFAEYFSRNYPGPDTIIYDPNWHAPKIYRAAISAYLSATTSKGELEAVSKEVLDRLFADVIEELQYSKFYYPSEVAETMAVVIDEPRLREIMAAAIEGRPFRSPYSPALKNIGDQ